MDEGAFLGTNKLVREQLRIVAGCSTLVELLHNSRKSLTVAQVGAALQLPELHHIVAWRPYLCAAAVLPASLCLLFVHPTHEQPGATASSAPQLWTHGILLIIIYYYYYMLS